MPYNMIKYNKEDGIAFIIFNRPEKRNALNHEMMKEIETALGDAEKNPDVSAVVLTGGDKYFISGTDMGFLLGDKDNQTPQKIYRTHHQTQSLYRCLTIYTKPTIAAIAGYAFGGGLELALCCDFRIATYDAKLGTPEIKVGIIPGAGGTQRLTRLMGVTKAKELILTGDPISGDEAYKFGLLNRVVDKENLLKEAKAFAEKFKSLPGYSIEMGKAVIDNGLNMSLKEGLELERIAKKIAEDVFSRNNRFFVTLQY